MIVRWAYIALAALLLAGCGKKGPPQSPFVRVPAAVDGLRVQRLGDAAYLTLTVPAVNVDKSAPVDIARIELYGYTGTTAPPAARFLEVATLVTSIPVVVPPPVTSSGPTFMPSPAPVGSDAPGAVPAGAAPGASVQVIDMLTPDELEPGTALADAAVRGRGSVPAVTVAAPGTPPPDTSLRRFYLAIPFSSRGRPGPLPAVATLPLAALPAPPELVTAGFDDSELSLTWEPSGGLLGFLLEQSLGPEPPLEGQFATAPAAVAPVPPATTAAAAAGAAPVTGPTRYNVYRERPAPSDAVPALPWNAAPPAPINATPLATTAFTDAVDFGVEHCYTVRAVRGTPPNTMESEPSAPTCITPLDEFPPAAPARLAGVSAEGAIGLIWEPNAEPDVAGYLVLRGAPGDATLQPLTAEPVTESRYSDTTVVAGMRYVYEVIAVDGARPRANRSEPSNRVEETAR